MYLSFVSGLGLDRNETDLCLIAEKPDMFSVPVRMRDLKPTRAAMHVVGPQEAVTVVYEPGEKALIITPLAAGLFLTPNLPQSPGYRVRRVKVVFEDNEYRTYFDRERGGGWEEWVANKERT